MEQNRINQILALLQNEPEDEFLNYALALELEKNGDRTGAIARIEYLLKIKPDYLGAYYKLGALLEEVGQKDQALAIYAKGIELARQKNNRKTLSELQKALQNLEDED